MLTTFMLFSHHFILLLFFCNKHSMFKVVFIVPQKEKSVLDYRKCCEEKELEIPLKTTYNVQVDNR